VTCRYNRYLAVAARVVRRSLKDDKRIAAERRGEMELRFAKWEVRFTPIPILRKLRRGKGIGRAKALSTRQWLTLTAI